MKTYDTNQSAHGTWHWHTIGPVLEIAGGPLDSMDRNIKLGLSMPLYATHTVGKSSIYKD